jgi:hypothetical protein
MSWFHRAALAALVLVASTTFAQASARPFTFSYDTYAIGKGNFEYEQWTTWKTHKPEEHGFDSFEFRHELEYGVADNFTLSLYLPNWSYEDSHEKKGTHFDSVGLEAIVYLTNPVKDPIGIGLYQELDVGDHTLEIETKLLLQKDIGKWTFVYNMILETEIEGVFSSSSDSEVTGEFNHTLGVQYALRPNLFVGAEALLEFEYENWSRYEKTNFFAGPVIHWRANEHFWITATAMFQITNQADEPDFQLRMIAGWEF